jgi:hypothetical protein
MGERPSGKTLDRIDRTRGYEPGNCRWATPKEQARNSNKPKAVIRSDGKRYASVIDAAVDVGVSYTGIVKVCNNAYGCKTSGGFGWAYFTEGQ